MFKIGKQWIPKYFFEDMELFKALLDYYNKVLYPFRAENARREEQGAEILERNGFDYDLAEDLKGYVVKLPKFAK